MSEWPSRNSRKLTRVQLWVDDPQQEKPVKHEFKLGLGPCGKTVSELKAFSEGGRYIIVQDCDDGSRQIFEYPSRIILSAIKRDYDRET